MKTKRLSRHDEVTLFNVNKTEKLLFSDLHKCVHDFQLKEHEQFLESFVLIFKSLDKSKHGILNEEQFMSLLEQMQDACRVKINEFYS